MKKTSYIKIGLVMLIAGLLYSGQQVNTGPFKFKMTFPQGVKFDKYIDGKWGGLTGYHAGSKTYLYAYAYKGATQKMAVYKHGVKVTGVKMAQWERKKDLEAGKKYDGFAWFEIYKKSYAVNTLYALVAKNKFHNISYLFIVYAPNKSYAKHQKHFDAWLDSCKAIK